MLEGALRGHREQCGRPGSVDFAEDVDELLRAPGVERALATLTAFDVAANAKLPKPRSFTYASPRTGDATFASAYDRLVPLTCRVVNRMDLVPQTPPAPLYEHVAGEMEINPIDPGPPPKVLVRTDLTCEHILTSYLHILTHQAGGPDLPLEAACTPLL